MEDQPSHTKPARIGFALVSTYSWLCVTVLVALVRYGQGLIHHKIPFGLDDATALAGTMFFVATAVSWHFAINHGLGKDLTVLEATDVRKFFKAMYAAAILSIVTMSFAKLSSAFLIHRVAPQTRKAKSVLFGMIAIWSTFAAFAVLFQCGIPKWSAQSVQCHGGGLLVAVTVLNIITDLVIAGWLCPTLLVLKLDKERAITVAILFGARAVVPVVAGAQIWAVIKAGTSSNPGRDAVNLAVLTQSVTSLSLISASVPRIKRSLGVGGSGMVYPEIHATELSNTQRSYSRGGSRGTMPKLVPSGSTNFTVTVSSKGSKDKRKGGQPNHWQGFMSMGTQQDEHTSTSSLFDREEQEGVMMSREVRVSVEENHKRLEEV